MKAVKTTEDKKPSGVIVGSVNYVYCKEELHGTAGRKLVFKYYIL